MPALWHPHFHIIHPPLPPMGDCPFSAGGKSIFLPSFTWPAPGSCSWAPPAAPSIPLFRACQPDLHRAGPVQLPLDSELEGPSCVQSSVGSRREGSAPLSNVPPSAPRLSGPLRHLGLDLPSAWAGGGIFLEEPPWPGRPPLGCFCLLPLPSTCSEAWFAASLLSPHGS